MIGQVARPTPGGGRRVAARRPAGGRIRGDGPPSCRCAPPADVVASRRPPGRRRRRRRRDRRRRRRAGAVPGRRRAPPALPRAELSAEAFADSMGVVIHLNYVDTAYGRRAEVIARLRELGVRHVREAMPTPPVGAQADGLRALRALGVRATLGHRRPERPAGARRRGRADGHARERGRLRGPQRARQQRRPGLARAAAGLHARAARRGPRPRRRACRSSGRASSARATAPASADLPGLVNGHPYPGGKPPEPVLGAAVRELGARRGGARGVVFTETGYHNALARHSGRSRRCPRPWRRSTSPASTPPPSAPGCGGRSSTSSPTRCPSPGCATPSSTSACCAPTSPRSPPSPRSGRCSRPCASRPGARRGAGGWPGRSQVDGGSDRDVQRLVLVRARRLPRPRPLARRVGLGPRPAHSR